MRPDVPDDLNAVLFKALSYEAGDRFPNCASMEAALETIARRHLPVASHKTIAQWVDAALAAEAPAAIS